MNQTVHQLLQLILQGLTWFLRTVEALWTWSWAQIGSVFAISWGNLPGWKLALGLVAILVLAAVLFALVQRGVHAFQRDRRRILDDGAQSLQHCRVRRDRGTLVARSHLGRRQRSRRFLAEAPLAPLLAEGPRRYIRAVGWGPAVHSIMHPNAGGPR